MASSPNLVVCCNACACFINSFVEAPAANLNFFSANSCFAKASVEDLIPLIKPDVPK